MTLHPVVHPGRKRKDALGPMRCAKCGVTASAEVTVHQQTTIFGEKWPPLCRVCSVKVERMRSLARRVQDCE